MHIAELLVGDVSVYLSRCNIGMAEHHLYRTNVSTINELLTVNSFIVIIQQIKFFFKKNSITKIK